MLELLGAAREGIFPPKRVELKVLLELKKCTHLQLRKDLPAYSMLHPADPDRNWEYFVGVLNRIKRIEMSNAVTAADTRALLPPVFPPKKGPPPAAPLLTTGADGIDDGTGPPAATRKAKALAAAAAAKLLAAGGQQGPPPVLKGAQAQKPPTKPGVNQLSFITKAGAEMTQSQRITHLRNALKNL